MDLWLEHLTEQVSLAADEKSATTVFQNLAYEAGFQLFAYISVQANTHKILSNYPEAWQQRYVDELYVSVDPIMLGARHKPDPFAWANPTPGRLTRRQQKFFAEAAEFGIRSGISIPIRSGFGQMAMLTLASSEHDYAQSRSMTPTYAAAAFGQVHARLDILKLKPRLHVPVELTPGQLTCLRWNAEGKTADDIADIEKTSPHNVRFHLKGAKRALGAATLTQAARIATKLGLI
ncbi:autoinducer binding domain-containing protein [Rhizobium sp. C4]|uniref:autoinducer binding domain-containing protein n=1 Tax=Rhizobium sp. C4 TaxID=1349800 RepID=UPI001E4F93CA|nr:autoinducer binding domain-containing protein [Rhizobium sp. C4]MCD2175094.1 autoinducer binding domain-containing protein [Rhizobium sp. C4]